MKVIVTEKPSVAKDIAAVLNVRQSKEGYLEGNDYRITWAYGHLVELAPAKAYIADPWNVENLPIMPERYRLQVKQEGSAAKQYNLVKDLLRTASLIINATDAGREGELIFRYIYELAEIPASIPVKRLWISSLTKEAIEKGFSRLIDQAEKDNLYQAARARSQCDWLIGINATIALTKTLEINQVTSLGRVQTPTYCLVTERYLEHKNHTRKAYYKVYLRLFKEIDFTASYETDFENEAQALAIFNNDFPQKVRCKGVLRKETRQNPPLPFDLTSLQRKANQKFKFSSQKTLDITQGLYEKKLLTYPRTDSRYITEDMFEPVQETVRKLAGRYQFEKLFENIKLSRNCINDNKVSDHHAIIPTGHLPEALNEAEQKIYDLVATQFLAAFHLPCVKEITEYRFVHNNLVFHAKGTVILSPGWSAILREEPKEGEEEKEAEEEKTLPEISENEMVSCKKVDVKQLYTQPKPLLTEASLLSLMQHCGKDFDDEDELPAELKNKGIGTPATRASIIESIIRSNYIAREKNTLVPTELGLQLYPVVKNLRLADVAFTGNWEATLYKVEKGELDYRVFMRENEKLLAGRLLPDIFSIKEKSETIRNSVSLPCPKCKKHTVATSPKAFFCKNEGCGFILGRRVSNKTLSESQFRELVERNRLSVTKIASAKDKDRFFDAILSLDSEYKLKFDFPERMNRQTELKCPRCQAAIKETEKVFVCSAFKMNDPESCTFKVFKVISGKKITDKDIQDLLTHGKTKWYKDFISKNGKKFEAMLVLKREAGFTVELVFKPTLQVTK